MSLSYKEAIPIGTPWGGNGSKDVTGEDGTKFMFSKNNNEKVRSSVSSGQIPILFYIWYVVCTSVLDMFVHKLVTL